MHNISPTNLESPMPFTFIKATDNDRAYLLSLRKLTMVEHLERSGQFLSEEEHLFRLNDDYDLSHLITHDRQVVGTLKFREGDKQIEILQLQIHPDFQGKGLGQQVLEQVISSANPKDVELTVLKVNRALNLYKRLGFVIYGEDQFEFFMRKVAGAR
ncbi:N-acetyltransferase GCN5 [Gallaecimonas xiamenensis 3-C-1]|uniref:N-acetyltransferase GCN5 n=2 Tax=Gallaecimonas TaxID=745410 RepID=K2JBC9_9GAMM|nr:N-acetyltransferase GCN5 [Gallaecimonas xiamenensis 3-C-1]